MTNDKLRENLLGLGVYLRAQSNRLNAEADASRRHAEYIDRLVNEWTPDAPAVPPGNSEALTQLKLLALDINQHVQGHAAPHWRGLMLDRVETVERHLEAAPAAPAVPEVGSQWIVPGTGGVVVIEPPLDVVRYHWTTSPSTGQNRDRVGFLRDFEPVPAPPAPEPRWIVARLCRGRNPYYCGGRGDDGKAVFSSERAGGTTWDEALGILGDDCERQPEDWWTYRIEPAGRVQA